MSGATTMCLQVCSNDDDCGPADVNGNRSALCYGSESAGYYCREVCDWLSHTGCPTGFSCEDELFDPRFILLALCYPNTLLPGTADTECSGLSPTPCSICDADPTHVCDCEGTLNGAAVEDMCGTCDDNPSNDCAQDCAGVWGGTAATDMCGTCDDNPGNDCVQDCAGVWGGTSRMDRCGTCDMNAQNDCVPSCSGVSMLGGCWYYGATQQTCTEVCATHGGYDMNTRFVGSDRTGSPNACEMILAGLGITLTNGFSPISSAGVMPVGCSVWEQTTGDRGYIEGQATADAWNGLRRRACACLQ